MSLRTIITLPDAVLRQTSAAVTGVDDDIRRLMDDMLETMYDAPGIGLAAIQIAVPKRVIVVDVAKREPGEGDKADEIVEKKNPIFINPEIVWRVGRASRSTRRAACRSPITTRRSSARRSAASAISTATARRRSSKPTAARHLPAARDRSPQRRAVHRLTSRD
jgi:peptide deformylase